MTGHLEKFLSILEKEDKEAAVEFALKLLDEGSCDIVSLYEKILRPALSDDRYGHTEEKMSIWREHTRSGIIRTVIECCYPRVIEEFHRSGRKATGKSVIILCPDGETHEIGARMAADYFTLCGFKVHFVGSSTPASEFYGVLHELNPDYIAVSVTNYYNLVSAKKAFEKIREIKKDAIALLAGGGAFLNHPGLASEIGADRLVNSFEEISALAEEAAKTK